MRRRSELPFPPKIVFLSSHACAFFEQSVLDVCELFSCSATPVSPRCLCRPKGRAGLDSAGGCSQQAPAEPELIRS